MSRTEGSDHYFSAAPNVASDRRQVVLSLPDHHLVLETDRGVFSADEVDVGTRYLLLDAPMPPPDRALTVVDVGCGYGPITVALALRRPEATVIGVDVNERARALCRANADRLGLTNVAVLAPHEVPDDLRVDAVYANPPIRIGNTALHALLLEWLGRLRDDGRAVLVVHKHLGSDSLQRWLQQHHFPTVRLGSRLGYRLLGVSPSGVGAAHSEDSTP